MDRVATIFVVDDDPSVRRSLERLLRAAGHTVETFVSARQFLEQADLSAPGCLVLDVRMPGQSGLDLQQVLEAGGHQIPVVFITGHADMPLAQRAIQAGAVDLLAKPFDGQELLDAIARALSAMRMARCGHP
jgi:FixJ family two-component response regulator